jgi:methionyl-tRNA formyltransferase
MRSEASCGHYENCESTIGCSQNESVEILELTPAGKNEMRAIDWARGARILPGEIFG